MNIQVGVKILLKNKNGEYLVLQRSAEKYPSIGSKWDIPGGRIEINSPLMENLQREVFEETGLNIVGEPELIIAQDILKPGIHVVRLTYIGEAEGDIVLSDEHSQYQWVSLEVFKTLDPLDRYVKELINKKSFV